MAPGKGLVLADTGPLYAPADPSDQFHERARRELQRLTDQSQTIAVSYGTLLEVQSLAVKWLGPRSAINLVDDLLKGAALLNPTREDYEHAIERAKTYPDQQLTLHDCTLAIMSERLEAPVWTYDHHFDLMRVPVWRP